MKIDETVFGDVIVVEPNGRLTLETEEEFSRVVRRRLDAGRTRFVLNLAGVSYIDSCGLGALTSWLTSARRRGGDVKLATVGGRNLQLLTITKLSTVFETFDTPEEAVRSFERPRPGSATVAFALNL